MAISYDTATYFLLSQYVNIASGEHLERIEPSEFFKNPSIKYQYINLVTLDWDERLNISTTLDELGLDRFSYIHADIHSHKLSESGTIIGLGTFIYPAVWTYIASIGKDCIIHSFVKMAEKVKIGNNCFISGGVTIAGSSEIGNNCFIGTNVLIMDHVNITNDVRLLPSMTIRKTIKTPGTYYNPNVFEVKQFKDEK